MILQNWRGQFFLLHAPLCNQPSDFSIFHAVAFDHFSFRNTKRKTQPKRYAPVMNFDETIKVCESLILKIICFNMLWINPSARFSTVRDFLIVLEYQNGSKLAFLFRFCQLYFEHICDEIGLIWKFFLYLIFLNLRACRSKGHSPAPALFLNMK